jgi:hypothetical protein
MGLVAALAAVASAAFAQPTVPVEQAPYHVPVFSNDYVTLLDVFIPPGRTSGFHRHSLDALGVQIVDGARTGQPLGGEVTVTTPRPPGAVTFSFYSREPLAHAVTTTGDDTFHNIVVELLQPVPWGFAPAPRERETGYAEVLDNDRVRVWRAVLAPGEATAPIRQRAPGLRVVVAGGELVERVPGHADRGIAARAGQFFWQEGSGMTRALENVGSTRIELVEIELK